MPSFLRTCGMAAAMSLAIAGCSAKGPAHKRFVDSWGTYSVADGVDLRVSAFGMSQMRYELRHVPSDRVLVSDVGGHGGWFFVWDDGGRLWAHWDDVGTVVWVPVGSSSGGFVKHKLSRGNPLLNDVPPDVFEHLPQWVKQSLGLHASAGP